MSGAKKEKIGGLPILRTFSREALLYVTLVFATAAAHQTATTITHGTDIDRSEQQVEESTSTAIVPDPYPSPNLTIPLPLSRPKTINSTTTQQQQHHNDRLMSKSEKVAMSCYDRVAIGGELLLFDHPGARPPGVKTEGGGGEGEESSPVPPTAEFAVEELQAALRNKGKQAQEVNLFTSYVCHGCRLRARVAWEQHGDVACTL